MKHGIKRSALVVSALMIAACSSYHRDFSCSEYPQLGCRPTDQVFQQSEGSFVDYRRSSDLEGEDKSQGKKKSKKSSKEKGVQVTVAPATKQLMYVSPGDPVLTKPEVLRILFFPWEDREADLNAGGYIYVRLGEPEWLILKN